MDIELQQHLENMEAKRLLALFYKAHTEAEGIDRQDVEDAGKLIETIQKREAAQLVEKELTSDQALRLIRS